MSYSWEGKIVFITGASSGLGEGLALALARAGASLGLMARREDLLQGIAAQIQQLNGQVAYAVTDVSDREHVEASVATLIAALGQPDLLIANAGVGLLINSKRFDSKLSATVFRVNLLGAIYSIGAVLPAMVERGHGHVAAVSSIAGFRGLPSMGSYSGSKAGLSTFLESLRSDLFGTGVTVTTIHPGFVRTPMTDVNKFPMPFLVELDEAVAIMIRGLEKRRARIEFPWPIVWIMKFVRLIPAPLWDLSARLLHRIAPAKKLPMAN